MTQLAITLYFINKDFKEKSLCQLIAKIYASNVNSILKFEDETLLDKINDVLWTFSQKEFVPHGSFKDPLPEKQPVYLTTGHENPNNATVKVLIGLNKEEHLLENKDFTKLLFVLNDDIVDKSEQVEYIRGNFSEDLIMWQQNHKGLWEPL